MPRYGELQNVQSYYYNTPDFSFLKGCFNKFRREGYGCVPSDCDGVVDCGKFQGVVSNGGTGRFLVFEYKSGVWGEPGDRKFNGVFGPQAWFFQDLTRRNHCKVLVFWATKLQELQKWLRDPGPEQVPNPPKQGPIEFMQVFQNGKPGKVEACTTEDVQQWATEEWEAMHTWAHWVDLDDPEKCAKLIESRNALLERNVERLLNGEA